MVIFGGVDAKKAVVELILKLVVKGLRGDRVESSTVK